MRLQTNSDKMESEINLHIQLSLPVLIGIPQNNHDLIGITEFVPGMLNDSG